MFPSSDFLNFKLGNEIGDIKQNLEFSVNDRIIRRVKNQFNDYNYIYKFASADLEFNLFFNYYKGMLSSIVLVEVVNIFSQDIDDELKFERQKIINLYKKKYGEKYREMKVNEKDTWSVWLDKGPEIKKESKESSNEQKSQETEIKGQKEILINQNGDDYSNPLRIEYKSLIMEKLKEKDDINNI